MTATQTPAGRDGGGSSPRPAGHHAAFDAVMNSGAPIVDNAGHLTVIGQLEYDGPRCAFDCGTAVDNDGEACDPCGDQPHEFVHDGGYRDNWCVCGRIRAIGGHSTVHGDDEWGAA